MLNEAKRRNKLRHETAQAGEPDPGAKSKAEERTLAIVERVIVRLFRQHFGLVFGIGRT